MVDRPLAEIRVFAVLEPEEEDRTLALEVVEEVCQKRQSPPATMAWAWEAKLAEAGHSHYM